LNREAENRKNTRINVFGFLKVIELNSGNIHKARMVNYSNEGLYFESNSLLNTGTLIFCIVNVQPTVSAHGISKFYRAIIVWRKKLQGSIFNYGYGTHFKSLDEIKDLFIKKNSKNSDRRKHPRRPFSASLRLATRDGVINGTTKNISPTGVFIASKKILEPGQILVAALPSKNGNEVMVTGRVMWSNGEGFGVKFLKII
jgi:hypothetical protein